CTSEWGVETKDINFLHFLVKLDFEERALTAGTNKMYRIEGGLSRMVRLLGERVQGVVPGASLKLEHQLIAIRARPNGYECTFRTPKGSDTVVARQIICTLPWSTLKDVDGFQGLELTTETKNLITNSAYASHSKVAASFKDPFWKKKTAGLPTQQGIFRGDLKGVSYWDSSRGQPGQHGIITGQRGGKAGAELGIDALNETVKDLQNFRKDIAAPENFQSLNWSQKPFAKGSRYNANPGSYLVYVAAINAQVPKNSFYLAGEHMSFRDAGTMNGAIQTAYAAAEKAMQKVPVKHSV
ncbi:MAG: hypothetical protein EOP06_30505, partial [Proteobacteria bacterium]